MAIFRFVKKEKEAVTSCACGENTGADKSCSCGCEKIIGNIQSVKVLGLGCKNCHAMLEATKQAMKNIGLGIEAEYVTDMEKIMEYGVMTMPALVVNEQVVSAGRVLKTADVEKLLNKTGC